jgi:hypothetical protein
MLPSIRICANYVLGTAVLARRGKVVARVNIVKVVAMDVNVVDVFDGVVVVVACVATGLLLRYGVWRPHTAGVDSRPRERVHPDSWPHWRPANSHNHEDRGHLAPQELKRQPTLPFGAPLGSGPDHAAQQEHKDQNDQMDQKDQEPVSARGGRKILRTPLG